MTAGAARKIFHFILHRWGLKKAVIVAAKLKRLGGDRMVGFLGQIVSPFRPTSCKRGGTAPTRWGGKTLVQNPFLISGPDIGAWPDCWVSGNSFMPSSLRRGRIAPPPPSWDDLQWARWERASSSEETWQKRELWERFRVPYLCNVNV